MCIKKRNIMEKILFYTSRPDKFATEITCTLALSTVHAIEFFTAYSYAQLIELFRTEPKNQLIAILTALSHDELDELISIKQMFETVPVVLILPDEHDDTLHKAHKLYPRFLATEGYDFKYVLSVVQNLADDLAKKCC